jgi:Tol biopolymer transport system component
MPSRTRRPLLSLVIAALYTIVAGQATARAAVTEMVSVDAFGGPANESSFVQDISDDGRFVAFTSFASDLVPGDTNGATNPFAGIDVFVRDRLARATERVSVSSTGAQAGTSTLSATMSADGRLVAFDTSARNLVPGDTNGRLDVFVRDRVSGTTERLSVSSAGAQGNGDSVHGAISPDGRFVAFASTASNLVAADDNGQLNAFLHDRLTGATELVSVPASGGGANGASDGPSVSAGGRFVAFASEASNLVPGDTNTTADVFVRDRRTGTTERVSVATGGAQAVGSRLVPGGSFTTLHALSGDGRFVTFSSAAPNLVAGDTNRVADIFVHDRATGVTRRVSVSSAGAQADDLSQLPAVSPDGRFVGFNSLAFNLVPGDTSVANDAFLHDSQTGLTERINVTSAGGQAIGGGSGMALPSAGARIVAFDSLASNLVPDDTNANTDVFVRVRGSGPGDAIRVLITTIDGFGLPRGTRQSLVSKLQAALIAAEDNDAGTDPCGPLGAFVNHVRAQSGKHLSAGQAARLTADLGPIRTSLGCAVRW